MNLLINDSVVHKRVRTHSVTSNGLPAVTYPSVKNYTYMCK